MQLELWQAALVMAACVGPLLVFEVRSAARARATFKVVASLLFVVAGAIWLPLGTAAGALVAAGLVLSLVGDLALIAKGNKPLFLAGLGAFLGAHLCYAASFVARGVSVDALLIAAAALVVLGAPLSRWLAAHVKGGMRVAVAGYVVAITAMVALAVGAFGAGAPLTLPLGALLFYLSDLCVARERFVARSRWNATVGLPLYYAAQLLIIDGMR